MSLVKPQIYCEEAFGPVAVLSTFNDFDDAIDEVNDSVFGPQAGIFTRDLYKAQKAWDELEVGGVIIGDVPSWRVDNMPYGGVKNSGLGRKGPICDGRNDGNPNSDHSHTKVKSKAIVP